MLLLQVLNHLIIHSVSVMLGTMVIKMKYAKGVITERGVGMEFCISVPPTLIHPSCQKGTQIVHAMQATQVRMVESVWYANKENLKTSKEIVRVWIVRKASTMIDMEAYPILTALYAPEEHFLGWLVCLTYHSV